MKKIYIVLGLIVIVLIGIVVFSTKPVESDIIKIGVIGPVTGSSAGVYYEPLKKGIDIALAEITIYGDKKVAMTKFGNENIIGVIIEDKIIHDMMKMIFELAWNSPEVRE